MSASLEALAMAGMDYMEWGVDIEEWERDDQLHPPHLLADIDDDDEEEYMTGTRKTEEICFGTNNSSSSSYNKKAEDDSGKEKGNELCRSDQMGRSTAFEKIWLYCMSIAKMVPSMIKGLIILWMARRLNNISSLYRQRSI